MEIVLCMRPISEENTIKKVSEVVQNDTEASYDLWFAFLTGIFIGNLQKTVQFKDQCPFFYVHLKKCCDPNSELALFKSAQEPCAHKG